VMEDPPRAGEVGEVLPQHTFRLLVTAHSAQVASGRLDELYVRHAVLPRNLERSQDLADAYLRHGTAEDRRVVRHDDALGVLDNADTEDSPAPDGEVGGVPGDGAQLEEGRVRIEE